MLDVSHSSHPPPVQTADDSGRSDTPPLNSSETGNQSNPEVISNIPVASTSAPVHSDHSVQTGPQKQTVDSWIRQSPWVQPVWVDEDERRGLRKIFCSICKNAEEKKLLAAESKRKGAYTTAGFTDWPNAVARFLKHEDSQSHRTATSLLKPVSPGAAGVLTAAKKQEMVDASTALCTASSMPSGTWLDRASPSAEKTRRVATSNAW